ncbi:hypothetical protein LTR05_004194 [Lithohypha guttulata]|uniref:Calpain catalytic domain-containing protein n=1 Tax=Lithohypha guttulata TaxID=1690604 RepID=A0AAN7T350_9EURO|nr:hypothetical protein LTR05_004194 [Lithohypha guttulata]
MPASRSQKATSHRVKQLTSQCTNSSLKYHQLPIRGKPPSLRARAGRARKLANGDRTGEELNEGEEARQGQSDSGSEAPLADERPDTQGKKKNKPKLHPQERINQLWANFGPEHLGKITKILPDTVPSVDQTRKPKGSLNATNTYNEARSRCEDAVKRIVAECIASNTKYSDLFNIEADLKVNRRRDFLDGLLQDPDNRFEPSDVKRVSDIFDKPTFFSNGATSDDIIQGANGDCWLMSAFSILSCSKELVEKVCVIRDQDVGVYGFVFYRDGEWHPTIIDDKLYLGAEAFDEGVNDMLATWGKEQEQKYTELFQRGSRALYFAKCRDENETWVPLLEKAFAKAHAGYAEIQGGQTGEGVEDLTGGVTTEIYTTNILNKDKFWTNELRQMGKEFLFGASDALYREWRGYSEDHPYLADLRKERRNSLIDRHAYAVLDTYDDFGERLVKVRNPWGRAEWSGAWADGSSQWTAEWLQRVGHKFGDDGVFWMSYSDFLNHFKHIDRTRLFDDSWYTSQTWASMQVPFSNLEYQQTKFIIDVPEDTETVIVLSQLDDRYWQGFEEVEESK